MKRIHRRWLPGLFACLAGLARIVHADESTFRAPSPAVAITLVAGDKGSVGVEEVVTELLSRDGQAVAWTRRVTFQPEAVFEEDGGHRNRPGVAAWIDLSSQVVARLYFRDAGGRRFFIRSLSLPHGLDELATEEIALVVRNALVALSQGDGEFLTRAQVREALIPNVMRDVTNPGPALPPPPLRLSVSALGGVERFAPDPPAVARATLSLAVTRGPRWGRMGGGVGGWFDLGYQFTGHYRGPAVGADLNAMSVRAGALWGIERTVRLVFGLGAGLDRVHYQPRAAGASVDLASTSTFHLPVISGWTGLDFRLTDGLAFTSRLSLDVALAKVHFDLRDGEGKITQVLVPYRLRPAVSFGLVLVF